MTEAAHIRSECSECDCTHTSHARTLDENELAHKAAQIGYTYGALGRDFEYVYKNVNDMLAAARAEEK